MEGWIKIHRRFQQWEWYTNSEMVHLFIHLLITATHKDGKWKGHEIKRGQTVAGISSLHKKTGISVQTIRTCINRLKSTGEITVKSTNKFSIITICNYEDYQGMDNATNTQINTQTNKQLTNNQQTTNYIQEGKEVNKKAEEAKNKKEQILKNLILEDNLKRERETKEFIDDLMNDRI